MYKITFIIFIFFMLTNNAWSNIHYANASQNPTAQILFDKGMLNYYAYFYTQAEYDFRQALVLDPNCGICHWGLAIAKKHEALELGLPFANLGFDDIQKAIKLTPRQNEFQYDVIKAALTSFSLNKNQSSKQLQHQYIQELKKLYDKYKNNLEWREESLALYVDAIAYYFNVDDGLALNHCSKTISEDYKNIAVSLLKPVLSDAHYVDHPGLIHTYIHMTERDLKDPLGLIAAKKLPQFANGMIAHYAHMPNHIYWRRGMYDKAIVANLNAIAIDQHYFNQGGPGLNSYYYEYHYLHSYHFLTVLGILTNNFELALKNAKAVKNLMDPSRLNLLKDYRDVFYSLEHLVLARFNKWDEVLKLEVPKQVDEFGMLFIKFTNALAYLNLDEADQYKKTYNEIKNTLYTRANLIEMQTLILTYLKASEMGKQGQPLKQIENTFLENQSDIIENKLFVSNPPIWLFPYTLLLSDISRNRGDAESAKKYHLLYEKKYPHSSLGLNTLKS